jgi:hypothetical protein
VEILKDWFRETIEGWNRHPTPHTHLVKRAAAPWEVLHAHQVKSNSSSQSRPSSKS